MPHLEAGVDGSQELAAVVASRGLDCRAHAVLVDAQHRLLRRLAGDRPVERGAEGVEIGPRPLQAAVAGVLLVRGIARLDDARERAAHLRHGPARRPEVEQHGGAVRAHDDVVGGDVAVQEVGRVHHLERIEQRGDEEIELVLRGRALEAAQPGLQAHALLEAHHHVGGGVGLEHAADANDGGMLEARQRARLLEEVGAPLVEGRLVAFRLRPHAHGGVAVAEFDRVVLLDGHHGAEVEILGLVGDAESAGPDDAHDAIAAVQNGIDGQHQPAVQQSPQSRNHLHGI